MTPAEYNLPHNEFRPHQLETIDWCFSNEGTLVMEAVTGSGKTAAPAAISSQKPVIALCRTKNLQRENYGNIYGAEVLFGRGNYKCIHPDHHRLMCDECPYIHTSMHKCEYSEDCKYLVAKKKAMASPFTSLNYWYFLTAKWPREEGSCQYLFLDEAHELSALVLGFAGAKITHKEQTMWDLPPFPVVTGAGGWKLRGENPIGDAIKWLTESRDKMADVYISVKRKKQREWVKQSERMGMKLRRCLSALQTSPEDWFIRSGSEALQFGKDLRPGFWCRPLTARHHFPNYFLNGHTTVAMSATIGKPEAFAEELGIEEYNFRAVPNQWPAESRLVHQLDVPAMGRKACIENPQNFEYQADAIAEAIKSCNPEWSGLIHVTRKKEASLLAQRLARRGLHDRVWVMPGAETYMPTDQQVAKWNERKRKVPNSICISWSLWEGYDGLDEKINIVAKVPYPFLGDKYEKERMNHSKTFFLQRTAQQLCQGLGRTRRGRSQDYGEENGRVFIADGGVNRIKSYISEDVREAIV